ncbi:receptor-like protein EIX2 [Silene latifolia]|uniref:receptor-like protein EIX2 n=1 Tax=Silene latifolia TaxID=37657 RepID=UPI003D76C1C3
MGSTLITSLLIFTFIIFNTRWCSCKRNSPNNNSTLRCIPSERAALLNFKHNFTNFNKEVSSSWKGEECCKWSGVDCDKTTGHVLKLDLSGSLANHFNKMEKLESFVYLFELRQLESLDLSQNSFSHSSILRVMSSMKQLRYFYLRSASLGGLVPYELGNLTNLQELDLSFNMLIGEIPASLGNLTNLKELDLSYNNLSSISSSLRFPFKLESLSLSNNHLSGKIPTSLGKLSKLQKLDISSNSLEGTILSEPHFSNLSSLVNVILEETMVTLNFSSNWVPPFQLNYFSATACKINGQFPPWLQTQKNLILLHLSDANISGVIPNWFHTMQEFIWVDLSGNNLSGSPIIPINFFSIDLSYNSFSLPFLTNNSKPEVYIHADTIYLDNNFIIGPLPKHLDLIMPSLTNLDLSNNQINGSIPNSLCQSTSLSLLNIQNNNLTGVLPNCSGLGQSNLGTLSLSGNQIKGPIPDSFCQLTWLDTLDIQNNKLAGVIPNCLANLSRLTFVGLSNNNFKGHIPCFNNRDSNMDFYLFLNDNMLSGEIPSCLSDLRNLQVLDIGENQLSGKMLKWLRVEKLKELAILRLRDNKFSGTIPSQICCLPHLQLIDLGHNQFTGSIPRCLSNLTAMTSPNASSLDYIFSGVSEVMQGIERVYTSTLPYLVDIDLSSNHLVGSIPDDMTKISGLLSLNLSFNQLSGKIPENIGSLKKLISLDLSKNTLRGSIPTSIGQIYTLSHLNLSYNNLSGQIPTGKQLQTLSDQASIYAGNPYLCGDFLPRKCKSKVDELGKGTSGKGNGQKEKKLEKMGFDLVVVSGFATGFWGVVGCLVVNRRWRHAFFRSLEDVYNWFYVIVVLKVRVLKAKIMRGE